MSDRLLTAIAIALVVLTGVAIVLVLARESTTGSEDLLLRLAYIVAP